MFEQNLMSLRVIVLMMLPGEHGAFQRGVDDQSEAGQGRGVKQPNG